MAMRGHWHADGDVLSETDLQDLTDLLTLRIYHRFGSRAYALDRHDIAELITPYVSDLTEEDQRLLPWLVWDLLQEGMEIEYDS